MSKFKKTTAGDTQIWQRPERSIIHMFSEFIDNSKSSYEQMIENNIERDEYPIEITFNQQIETITIEDFGSGFNIDASISKIGRDKVQIGKTNQYFIGMKSAMNFFGDFSILISEREVNGVNHRYANFFIYMAGSYYDGDVELEVENKTGSKIILFSSYLEAKRYWREELNFINKEMVEAFPSTFDLEPYEETFESYPNTHKFLDNLSENFPYLTASLFQRYSFLVNRFPKIKIFFKCFNASGYDMLLNNSNQIKPIKIGTITPEYFSVIKQNDFYDQVGFSFDEFFKSSDHSLVKNILNGDEADLFQEKFEELLFDDLFKNYKKLRMVTQSDSLERDGLGNLDENFHWIKYPEASERLIFKTDKNWTNYNFASVIVSRFATMFFKQTGTLTGFRFNIENLFIDNSGEITLLKNNTNEETFDLNFDLNIYSNKFSKNGGIYGDTSQWWVTGFNLIQNNRAILNGPNFSNSSLWLNIFEPFPRRMLEKELNNGSDLYFPNYVSNKKDATYVTTGGNVERWTGKIFGDIWVPNSKSFTAGTNKALLSNQVVLENYVLRILRDSGMNVISRWVHLIDNKAFKGTKRPTLAQLESLNNNFKDSESKLGIGKILAKILFEMEISKKQNEQRKGNLEFPIKNNDFFESYKVDDKHSNQDDEDIDDEDDEDSPEIFKKDIYDILDFTTKTFRQIKKDEWSTIKISGINLDKENQEIQLLINDKSFNFWNNSLIIKFNTESKNEENIIDIVDEKHVMITFSLDTNLWDLEELKNKLKKIIKSIYLALSSVSSYYAISKNKSISKTVNDVEIERVIKKYLNSKLKKIEKID